MATVQFSTDESTNEEALNDILEVFSMAVKKGIHFQETLEPAIAFKKDFARTSAILPQPTFHRYRSETEMMSISSGCLSERISR